MLVNRHTVNNTITECEVLLTYHVIYVILTMYTIEVLMLPTTKEKVAMNLCYLIQDDYEFANEIILEYLGLVDNNRLNDLLEFTNNEMRANV